MRGPVGTPGRYIVGERLEAHGVAEVFRAEPVEGELDAPIVLKRLPDALAGEPDFVTTFVDDARVAMRLDHAQIVKVHDFVASEQGVYLVMDLVDGSDLHAILAFHAKQRRTLPAELAAHIAVQALAGLDYAHRASGPRGEPLHAVHGGIAPSAIVVTRQGQVKLTDFGIGRVSSRARGDDARRWLRYLSPEQVRGEPIDGRSDVWSLGVVLAEMAMGTRLFDAPDDVQLLLMVRRGDLVRLDEHGAEIPRALEAIIRKALAVDLEQRFASARAFGDALMGFLAATRRRAGTSLADQRRQLDSELVTIAAIPRERATSSPPAPSTVGRIQLAKASPPAGVRAISDDDPPAPRAFPRAPTSPPQGALTPGRVVDLLCGIARDNRTCALVLESGTHFKHAWFHDGNPVFVASNVPEDRFGEFLVRRAVLTRDQLDHVLAVLDRYQGRMGQALVSLGLIGPVDAIRLLASQVTAKLVSACSWQDGTYELRDGETNPYPALTLELDTHAIVGKSLSALPVDRLTTWSARIADSPPELDLAQLRAFAFDATALDRLADVAAGATLHTIQDRMSSPLERLHFTAIAYVLWRCGILRFA
ncbi:MAG: serine/threonine protein kinase [Deltaproteobacteria bacterium]|nr:serine/threonine protein kinase [Deltaproteobacteria bacterium]